MKLPKRIIYSPRTSTPFPNRMSLEITKCFVSTSIDLSLYVRRKHKVTLALLAIRELVLTPKNPFKKSFKEV
jgi:hypothetical protein